MKRQLRAGTTPRIRGIAALLAVLIVAALPGSAQAVPQHTPTAFSPITGAGIGTSFQAPRGIGADEANGNIFVTSGGNDNVVDILNSEGGIPTGVASPYKISGFNFFFSVPNVAVDNSATSPSKGTIYVTEGGVKKYVRNAGTEQYEAAGELSSVPSFKGTQGVTVDDSGNVYVADTFGTETGPGVFGFGTITKFSPSGAQLWQIEMSAADDGPVDVAVDATGDVFVRAGDFEIFEYPANGLGEIEEDNFVEILVPDQAFGVTVDRETNTLYVLSSNHVTEFNASTLTEEGDFSIGTEGGRRMTVNHAGGLIYVANSVSEKVLAFTLNGPTLADTGTTSPTALKATRVTLNGIVNAQEVALGECKFEYGLFSSGTFEASKPCDEAIPTDNADHAVSIEASGLVPHTRYRYRLVTTNANGTNHTATQEFTTAGFARTAPASAITPAAATLNGVVLAEGSPVSECKFEYGTTTDYGTTLPCSPEAGSIPADFEFHPVSADLSGLLVGTTYHYRVVVTGGLGTEAGEDLTFVTLGPSVIDRFVSGLTETGVKLEALINPRGKATTYHFEYGSQGPCASNPCTSVPVSDAPIGGGSEDVLVDQPVAGLSPATTYHYWVVVANSDGVGHSAEGTFSTYAVPPSFDSCPNEGFRSGRPSAKLPDCRAYEQATPVDKNGADAAGAQYKIQASLLGDGITSQTKGGLPGGEGAQSYPIYLSQRGPASWSTQGLLPPPSYGERALVIGRTPDLAYSLTVASPAESDEVGGPDFALLGRDSATHAIQQITPYFDLADYAFAGASADDSKIFFEARGQGMNLTGNAATSKDNLYLFDRASEEVSLVGVLSGGAAPPGGSFAGPYNWYGQNLNAGGALGLGQNASDGYVTQDLHAISADGDKAFFTAGATGQIYLREGIGGETPETVQVSASQGTTPDPNGAKPAMFMGATPDGSTAFFTSCQKLTEDSTAHSTAANDCDTPSQGQDLYAYDSESGQLSDLTVDNEAGDPNGAEVRAVLGNSDDGSYVYFLANGDLDGAGPAERGNCEHNINFGQRGGFRGICSLYLWHAGTTSFITKLNAATDSLDWQPGGENLAVPSTGLVSANGQAIVFQSSLQLSGYGTEVGGRKCHEGTATCECPRASSKICAQYYRYQVGDAAPECVTCNPTGALPVGAPTNRSIDVGTTSFDHPMRIRSLSASGNQFFFETRDKLVGADTNGDAGCPEAPRPSIQVPLCQDVYEWEAPGAGSCSEASSAYSSQDGGCIYLLSTGTSPDPSFFADASASGNDAFIFTSDQLVPGDEDHLFDIYDASVGGGLASQNQPRPPEPCEGQACRGPASAPPAGAPSAGSAGFQGPGNPPIKRKHKKHKKHHKHHKSKHHGQGGRK